MTEDRFDDLGSGSRPGGARRRESIGDRLAERDRTHPEPDDRRPPEVPRPGNKYAWVVGIAMLMGLGVLLFLQTIPNSGEALFGPKRGRPAPDFAVPLALGPFEGDANVCQRRPCPKGAGSKPACELRRAGILNSCELRERPLVLSFIFDRGAECLPQVDRTERVKEELPGVTFATVYFTRKDRGEVRQLVRGRRWAQPVGLDRDGQVSNMYGVGVCPTTIFMREGGIVSEAALGNLTEEQLLRKARRLRRRS